MAMALGQGGAKPNINVTPLIDVLLVLLIIFMVISPLKPARFEAKVPAEPKDQQQVDVKPNPLTLVVGINKERAITLNNESTGTVDDPESLTNKLRDIFKQRESNGVFKENSPNEIEKTIFIKSPKSVRYGDVVKVIDAAKFAGAQPIGLQIDDLAE